MVIWQWWRQQPRKSASDPHPPLNHSTSNNLHSIGKDMGKQSGSKKNLVGKPPQSVADIFRTEKQKQKCNSPNKMADRETLPKPEGFALSCKELFGALFALEECFGEKITISLKPFSEQIESMSETLAQLTQTADSVLELSISMPGNSHHLQ